MQLTINHSNITLFLYESNFPNTLFGTKALWVNLGTIFFNNEFQILYHLFSYPNRIFAKEELIELICINNDHYINQNTIRTYINNLRKKLDMINELEIVTVRGLGYKGVIKK